MSSTSARLTSTAPRRRSRSSTGRVREFRLGCGVASSLILLATVAFVTAAAGDSARLGARERRIVVAVDRGVPDALRLIERTVNVNSGTMNWAGVREVGRLFTPELQALGFTTRWVEGAEWGRAGHLVAERRGSGRGPRVLLIGHLDTVFEADSPFQRFERLDDSTARGPGTTDMKGGNVVALLALRALAAAGVLDRLEFRFVLSGDEENAGLPLELSRRDLRDAADWADVGVGFEDGAGDPRTAVVARRGSSSWTLRVAGKPSHSSQIFSADVGSGAIYEAARILTSFRDSLSGDPLLTFNPGLILGGTRVDREPEKSRGSAFGKSNVVAESTVVTGDLRAVSLERREEAKATMRRIVASHLPLTTAEIEFRDSYPPLAPSAGNRALLARYDEASRDLGLGPVRAVNPAKAGAADISFADGRVDYAIDGVGLMGSGGHTVHETADLRTLPSQAKRMALLLTRLARDWDRLRTPSAR